MCSSTSAPMAKWLKSRSLVGPVSDWMKQPSLPFGQMHFFPAMRNGTAIPMRVLLRYNFRKPPR